MDTNNSSIKTSNINIISNKEAISAARRHDRFLCLLNEEEASILANSKIAARVQISEALWTKEKLADMIFQNLAEVSIIIEYKDEILQIPKYSEQVIDLATKIAVFKPTPELTINLSDLDPQILKKLSEWDRKSRKGILLAAGRRLFKIFYPYYYNTITDLLKVKIER